MDHTLPAWQSGYRYMYMLHTFVNIVLKNILSLPSSLPTLSLLIFSLSLSLSYPVLSLLGSPQ